MLGFELAPLRNPPYKFVPDPVLDFMSLHVDVQTHVSLTYQHT